MVQIAGRCRMCRLEVPLKEGESPPHPHKRILCDDCSRLNRAPRCLNCGEPVRGAKSGDPEPYHQECRRCSSCGQVCRQQDVQKLAGRLLCKCCSHLFGHFFLPSRRSEAEHVKEAFQAWDTDGSGSIEVSELGRVLKALDPDFADRDVRKLIRTIDKNNNGRIDFSEFTEWIMKGDPLDLHEDEDGFEKFCAGLMRASGKANSQFGLDIAEVQLREDGIYFFTESGDTRVEATNFVSNTGSVELTTLDPEEFITKVEATEAGLSITMNTGRLAKLGGEGQIFGPFIADEGFHIVGLRTKPTDDGSEKITGVDLCPLANAKSYSSTAALRFAAERELLQTLRDLLSKAAVNVNHFNDQGVTALMLAAQYGNVGAMRLLVQTKANPNLCDEDGWTALTFASRCGNTSAVDILLEKGASQEGDSGHALQQALRQKHNSAARALLRAGFGPQPKGTFAIEELLDDRACLLSAPEISPPTGNYTEQVNVKISAGEGARLFYTLDGRDPTEAGHRCRGSLVLSNEHNFLRVVAMKGKERSPVVECIYTVCHYSLPHEVVGGALKVRTFPEVQHLVTRAFANALGMPQESLSVKVSADEPSGGKCWLRIPISDPTPAHCLHIDRSYTLVKGPTQKKAYLQKFTQDIKRATGATPESIQVSAGSIILDFILDRKPAAEMVRQLADPTSYLLTKAKLKLSFADAEYKRKECLGDRVSDPSLHCALHRSLGSKAIVDEVIGIGEADEGVIAVCCPENQVKKLRKPFGIAVANAIKDLGAVCEPLSVGPEELTLEYSVDVVNDGARDGGGIVRQVNDPGFKLVMERTLVSMGLSDAEVKTKTKAQARELAQLEFHLEWDYPVHRKQGKPTPVQDYLDGICLVYREETLAQVVDFRSATGEQHLQDGGISREAAQRNRSISRAVQHSGDVMSPTGGMHRMTLDLAALPTDVTDLYFVLAAYDCDDLSIFPNPSVQILDAFSQQKLTHYTVSSANSTQAVIMCCLSRAGRNWIVRGLGIPTDGSVRKYDPIKEAIAKLQLGYGHWERRGEFIKLKVLHKLGRVTQGNASEAAQFLQSVLSLPVAIFQLIVLWL